MLEFRGFYELLWELGELVAELGMWWRCLIAQVAVVVVGGVGGACGAAGQRW